MMDQLEGRPVPGAEPGLYPVFSPDGQWILYRSSTASPKLRKIPVTGGAAITICDLPRVTGGEAFTRGEDWGLDNTILFGSREGLMRVSAAGGAPQLVTKVNRNDSEAMHSWPQFLPGDKTAVFTVVTGESTESARIAIADLKTGAYQVVVKTGFKGRYVPSGHLVFTRGSTLYAVPFDLQRRAVEGPETPVAEGLLNGFEYTFSESSVMVFESSLSGAGTPLNKLEWTDRNGVAQQLPDPPRRWNAIALSPDGKRVAGSIWDESGSHSDVWLQDLERHTLTRLTFGGVNYQSVWTPDSRWLTYFHPSGEEKHGIYRVPADKSGPPELLLAAEQAAPFSWTPDGKALLYTQINGKRQNWILPMPGSGVESKPRLFTRTSFNESNPAVSPDGKWVAYESDETGNDEIYVEPFPGPGGKSQVSSQGGSNAVWSRNGKELVYAEPNTLQLMAVDVATGPQFHAGIPRAMFKLPAASMADVAFDVTQDPKRFLVVRVLREEKPGATFVTITNWFDDLRRRAPVSR
jgi:serine/threonine-protein kinase